MLGGEKGVPGGDPIDPFTKGEGECSDKSAGEEIGGDSIPIKLFTIWLDPIPEFPIIVEGVEVVLTGVLSSPGFRFNWLSRAALNSSGKLNPKLKKSFVCCCVTYWF